jgi:CheY-like chemotaxis protein
MAQQARRETVLVVEADPVERERFGSWLEESGFDVVVCPGPTEPDYTCVGARDGVCPLVDEAGVVVLDMSLESEAVVMGTAAEEILGLYLLSGVRVVVLGSHPGDEVEGQLLRLHRHPDRDHLVGAVCTLFEGSGSSGPS